MNHLKPKKTKSGAPNWKERCLEAETKLIQVREKLSKQRKEQAAKLLDYQILEKTRAETIEGLNQVIVNKNVTINDQREYMDCVDMANERLEIQIEVKDKQISRMKRTQNYFIVGLVVMIIVNLWRLL